MNVEGVVFLLLKKRNMNSDTLKQEIIECIREIQEEESSGRSRSHAGHALTIRFLRRKYEQLLHEWEKLHPETK